MFEFEVCANGVQSVISAQQGGATRVELCAGIPEGGTTPTYGTVLACNSLLENKSTKMHVIIRPRGGDFHYNILDFRPMQTDITLLKDYVDGFVFGCLNIDGSIDIDTCQQLISFTGDRSLTFHRAFDMCSNPLKAIDQLAELGFQRILTSGGMPTAEEGIPQLKKWQRYAEGKITLMAGCGVNEHNIKRIYEETGITAFHFSARECFESKMTYRNPNAFMSMKGANEFKQEYTTAHRVRRIINELQ